MVRLRKFGIGMLLLGVFFFGERETVKELLLHEGLSFYNEGENKMLFKGEEIIGKEAAEIMHEGLIGRDDIIFQDDSKEAEKTETESRGRVKDISEIKGLDELRRNYYIVDSKTAMSEDLFDTEKFMAADLKITRDNKPRVLVFHTHSHEMFADSNPNDMNEGIIGAGNRFCQRLEEYGIKTIHITDSFDIVNGQLQIMGAYERMEPVIIKVLEENPSIEMVIDMHRDGVNDDVRLVKSIDGRNTAQIMLFNGLCRINENGQLSDIAELPNPYLPTNLALSFRLQRLMDSDIGGFSRGIYLNAYRYSLNMKDKSILVEVGAQTNTKEEIYNAVDLFAKYVNEVTK